MDFLIIRLATGFEGGSRFAGAKRFARKRLKNKKARRQRRQLKIAERGAPLKALIRRLDQKSIPPKGRYGFFDYTPCDEIRGWEPFCGSKTLCLKKAQKQKGKTAKAAIKNCRAGRAAKGANPSSRPKIHTAKGVVWIFYFKNERFIIFDLKTSLLLYGGRNKIRISGYTRDKKSFYMKLI